MTGQQSFTAMSIATYISSVWPDCRVRTKIVLDFLCDDLLVNVQIWYPVPSESQVSLSQVVEHPTLETDSESKWRMASIKLKTCASLTGSSLCKTFVQRVEDGWSTKCAVSILISTFQCLLIYFEVSIPVMAWCRFIHILSTFKDYPQ